MTRTRWYLGTILLAVIVTLLPLCTAGAEEVLSKMINTTPALTCGEWWGSSSWTNAGPSMRITGVSLWQGGETGLMYQAELMRSSDGAPLIYFSTAGGNASQSFGDNWMTLDTGDTLILWAYCAPPGGPGRMGAQIFYTLGH